MHKKEKVGGGVEHINTSNDLINNQTIEQHHG